MLLSSTSIAPLEAALDNMPDTLCQQRALRRLRIPLSLHWSTHSLSATEKTSRPHLTQVHHVTTLSTMAERYLFTFLETTPGILLTDCSGYFTMASGFTLPIVSLYTIRVCRAAQSGKVPVLKTFLTQPPSPDHSYFLIAFFLLRIQSMTLQLTLCREKKQSYFDRFFSVDQGVTLGLTKPHQWRTFSPHYYRVSRPRQFVNN